ncbi:uncharacterized protein BO96DRAFT_407582 [Aspergillus niger CBS 101883]|uniref:uncharacterized protein n=1 Tax=Aspergillus lacticoffeatus (strain CBS 101883) TaxID=1450533 RepID=UPI000D7F3FF3|nr:uncharacterized protein BO96DRAFT_407582 [Aspergillus niger CBS 101883]PYH62966.1 hypothetical protein BO96DRAFT_407582 [Aspergillus niger CBS 101883]
MSIPTQPIISSFYNSTPTTALKFSHARISPPPERPSKHHVNTKSVLQLADGPNNSTKS